jgi:hypothetical protein
MSSSAATGYAHDADVQTEKRPHQLYFYSPRSYLPDGVNQEGAPLAVSVEQTTTLFPLIKEMDGIILMVSWNQLCPISPDNCDFTFIDSVLNYWGSRGKKVVLNIATVGFPYVAWVNGAPRLLNETPQWVLDRLQPAPDNSLNGTYVATPTTIIVNIVGGVIPSFVFPAYWDHRFVEMSRELAFQLARRYDGHPVISAVRIPYGLQGEENPTVLGASIAKYPAGFTFASWFNYDREITDIYLEAFKRSRLEADITYTPWIRAYALTNADPAFIALADGFVNYLIENKDRITLGFNGFSAIACPALTGVTCPETPIPGYTVGQYNVEVAAMGYVLKFKADGGQIALEGGTLLNAAMSGSNVINAINALGAERYDMWGGDAASINYARNGFSINSENEGTLKWYKDAIAKQCAAKGQALLSGIWYSDQRSGLSSDR